MKYDKFILFSKDACGKFNLPVYGNKIHKTPNIDKLVENGTVFYRHYATAPSTAMSFTSILTGEYPYKFPRKTYEAIKAIDYQSCFFDNLSKDGYRCHIIMPKGWESWAENYVGYFGAETKMHFIENDQSVGAFFNRKNKLERNTEIIKSNFNLITNTINNILSCKEKTIIWIHLPHVTKGYEGYGSDTEFLDELLGYYINKIGMDSLAFTADHGHMNFTKNKIGYGFDVYENAISVPLITPKIKDISKIDYPTSHIDLYDIIFNKKIVKRDFILVDSAYYAQPKRKIAIIYGKYKYIYNKRNNSEELYDLTLDPIEERNLVKEKKYDIDRKQEVWISDYYYYPYWKEAKDALIQFRNIKSSFWKKESFNEKIYFTFRETLSKNILPIMSKLKKNK